MTLVTELKLIFHSTAHHKSLKHLLAYTNEKKKKTIKIDEKKSTTNIIQRNTFLRFAWNYTYLNKFKSFSKKLCMIL